MRAVRAALVLALLLLLHSRAAKADAAFSDLVFDPHPGTRLPLAVSLTDEHGGAVRLGNFFSNKPVVLVLEYLRCKGFCGLTLQNIAAALDASPLDAGRDFAVVAISIDPRDTPADAAAAKAKYLARYHHPAANAGWHFLTGRQLAVQRIAESVGFPYRYDPQLDQYLHPAGFVLAAPDGVIARYILDLDLQPSDLRAAIADAGEGRAIGPVTRFVLWCRGHGPQLGRYSVPIEAAFVLASTLGGLIFVAVSVATRRRR